MSYYRPGCLLTGMVVIVLLFGAAVGAQVLPTNLDLIVETLEQAVDQALAEARISAVRPGEMLLVHPQAKHAANWLVAHILAERLLAQGIAVTLDSTVVHPGARRLNYRILDLKVTGRTGLWGRRIDRQSQVLLALSSTEGELLNWQQEFSAIKSDWVPKKRADLLENDQYNFAKTELTTQSWNQFFEPIIVSGVLGGLLYMFFSNR